MAKSTKYVAKNPIVRLNGKNYEVGQEVTGLDKDQEQRLTEIGAIVKPDEFDGEVKTGEGEQDTSTGNGEGESKGE